MSTDIEGAQSVTRQAEAEASAQQNTNPDPVRVAIPLGVALIVGIFIALGIEGDVLARLVRNSATGVAWAFTLAMLGVTLPLLLLAARNMSHQWIGLLAGLILLGASVLAVWIGVRGLGEREQPDIEVEVLDRTSNRVVSLRFAATGLSLQSKDRMLLRIIAFPANTNSEQVMYECREHTGVGKEPGSAGKVLRWLEAGPESDGDASSKTTVQVSRKRFAYVCAFAILSDPDFAQEQAADAAEAAKAAARGEVDEGSQRPPNIRGSMALIDLRSAYASAAQTPGLTSWVSNRFR